MVTCIWVELSGAAGDMYTYWCPWMELRDGALALFSLFSIGNRSRVNRDCHSFL